MLSQSDPIDVPGPANQIVEGVRLALALPSKVGERRKQTSEFSGSLPKRGAFPAGLDHFAKAPDTQLDFVKD